jgi:predicted thioredoxin/glutaredoxin
LKVELIYSPGCAQCAEARSALKAAAEQTLPGWVTWHELNVLDELDYTVQLGVLTLPAVAIDGELVFSSLPTPAQLQSALQLRIPEDGGGS